MTEKLTGPGGLDKGFDRNAMARSLGASYRVEQKQGESDDDFRIRLAGILRGRGDLIVAHEVYSGRRWDDPEQRPIDGAISGIIGAAAQALYGTTYSPGDPERQIADDIATGVVVVHGDSTGDAVRTVLETLGPKAGMDFLTAITDPKKEA